MLFQLAQAAPADMPQVTSPLISLVVGAIGIVSLVCWIMEIVAAFKKGDGPLMGILSIVLCSLGGFIIGWIHAKKWGIQKVMMIWTIAFVVALIANIIFGAALFAAFGSMQPAP